MSHFPSAKEIMEMKNYAVKGIQLVNKTERLIGQKEFTQALQSLKKLVDLCPNNSNLLEKIRGIEDFLKQQQAMKESLAQAEELIMHANNQTRSGKYTKALNNFKKASALLEPYKDSGHKRIIEMLVKADKGMEEIASLEKVPFIHESSKAKNDQKNPGIRNDDISAEETVEEKIDRTKKIKIHFTKEMNDEFLSLVNVNSKLNPGIINVLHTRAMQDSHYKKLKAITDHNVYSIRAGKLRLLYIILPHDLVNLRYDNAEDVQLWLQYDTI